MVPTRHRSTIADAEGRFKFKKLPAGEYYIVCLITWEAPYGDILLPTGGSAYAQVKLGEGEHVNVVVTR